MVKSRENRCSHILVELRCALSESQQQLVRARYDSSQERRIPLSSNVFKARSGKTRRYRSPDNPLWKSWEAFPGMRVQNQCRAFLRPSKLVLALCVTSAQHLARVIFRKGRLHEPRVTNASMNRFFNTSSLFLLVPSLFLSLNEMALFVTCKGKNFSFIRVNVVLRENEGRISVSWHSISKE